MILFGSNKYEQDRMQVKCDCCGTCRHISFCPDDDSQEMDISVLAEGVCVEYDLSLKQRLKQCFHILFKKQVYTDNICLQDKEDLKKMADYFNNVYDRWSK